MTKWIRIRKITTAGQAEIYLVKNSENGRQAAMKKLLKAPQLDDPNAELRRFEREVRTQSAMDHAGIMPIIGYNFKVDPPFYLMPLADETLADVIYRNPNGLDPDEAAGILLEVVDAVDYAHRQGVYHRDLKPANVLRVDGKWLVGDFGLCRDLSTNSTTITRSNTVVGTIAYMAPEQFDNAHEVNATADVFALARILYHMLTGRSPFPYAPLEKLSGEFRYLVSKAMAEEPADRYASVAEFGRQMSLIVGDSEALTSPTERAKELLSRALRGSTSDQDDLIELILDNSEDEVFFSEFVSRLPQPMLASFQAINPVAFEDIVRTFDRYSKGGHPFNYVDVIADFFANVFSVANAPMLRALALRRIMIVGERHNRFYVGGVFARLVTSSTDPQHTLLTLNVMHANPNEARWYSTYLQGRPLPAAIRSLLDETG